MLVAKCTLENNQAIVKFGVNKPLYSSSGYGEINTNYNSFRGLIDTGAQRSCLSSHVISSAKLVRHSNKYLKGVNHQRLHSLFWASMGLWGSSNTHEIEPSYDSYTSQNQTYFAIEEPIEVFDIENNESFDALIGMDILSMFNFSYNKLEGSISLIIQD